MKNRRTLSTDDYYVPAGEWQSEIKVKGSRFICTIVPGSSVIEVEQAYSLIKKKYYDATHNCFAWRIDEDQTRFSDDGEPNGTAGKPILQMIEGHALYELLCVVTRYFGGTKLGTGGLIRAYGDAAQEALHTMPRKIKTHWQAFSVTYNYSLENIIRRSIEQFDGRITESNYNESVKMRIAIPQSRAEQFKKSLLDLTHSQITLEQ